MRITFLSPPPNLSGGERVIAIYAEGLRRLGHEVLVVTPAPRPPTRWRWLRRLLGRPVRPLPPDPARTHLGRADVPLRILDHRPIVDADLPEADVVVATWWETAEWAAALAPSRGAKVHFMQDYEVWGGFQERVDATCRLPFPKIVIAGWVAALLHDRFGAEDVTLVPNGVDLELFRTEPRGKQPTPTVGLVYTTMANKGCDVMLAAFERARRAVPGLRLVAFGGKQWPGRGLRLPAGCDFGYRVPDERLKDYYARCDAWLFGTRVEGFGLPLLEAMACRTPVIATPAGAAPELLAGGGGILLDGPDDPDAMAAAIVQLVGLPEAEWRRLSDAAHATARRHTWERSIAQFEAVLARAAAHAAPGAGVPG
jgi:glycosyltransferase involved in cell wall biosynthesis